MDQLEICKAGGALMMVTVVRKQKAEIWENKTDVALQGNVT